MNNSMNNTMTSTMTKKALVAALLFAPLLAAPVAHAAGSVPVTAGRPSGANADRATRAANARPAPMPAMEGGDDATPGADGGDKGAVAPTGTVNLNEANEEQLQLLPGVGPAKATAIVAWRTKHGRFKKVDDLTRVKGFGRKTLQKLRSSLALTGPTSYRGKKNPTGDGPTGTPPSDRTP